MTLFARKSPISPLDQAREMMVHARRSVAAFTVLVLLVGSGPLRGQTVARQAASTTGGEPASLTSPSDYLGFPVGADFKLAGWDTITGYFNLLAAASPELSVDTLGRTTLGRPFIALTITSPANMARLEEIRRAQARLADPRKLADGELDGLLATQPAVVLIAHNIHSTEIASSQGVMELAYSLISDPDINVALDSVVVLLIPSVNPDGQQMVVDWYQRTVGTPYEGSGMPWLYHHYVGHDNNRDWFMLTQLETRLLSEFLYWRWYPEVVYDVHQMGGRGARFFVPPFDDPSNPNIDPLIVRMISLFGLQISTDLEAAGKSGVVNSQRYDLWWHGGLRTVPARHNMVGILSEAASARLASPLFQEPEEVDREAQRRVSQPNPWPGGWWRLRDIIDYQLIASRSIISLAYLQRRQLIRNYVEAGRRAVEAGRTRPPFAYIIPARQRDPGSAAAMLEVLRQSAVEIHRAGAAFTADDLPYEAGDWVVLMAQPYRPHAKDLLERQVYPDERLYPGGPPDTPYDVAGWTLPLQMGVDAVEVLQPFTADLNLELDTIRPLAGRVTGSGPAFLVPGGTNAANLAIHRVLQAGGEVALVAEPVASGGRTWPAGSAVLRGAEVRSILQILSQRYGLSAEAFQGSVRGARVRAPRVGLYQSWTASMDEGWTRWVFDNWDVAYRTLHDSEIRAGELRQTYDVIILPDLSPTAIREGRRAGTVPAEYAGGVGEAGAAALRDFVRSGGTLICLASSSDFAIEELGLPVKNVRPSANEQRSGKAFYAPGSILAAEIDAGHPLGYGSPETTAVYYSNDPVFELEPGASRATLSIIARYPERGQLLSGYALNADFLAGKAALIEARSGAGRVILFGFRPQHRGQPHGTFKLLFNSLYRGTATEFEQLAF